MQPLPLTLRSLVLSGLMLVGTGSAWAQLSASSPFLPPQAPGAAGPAQPAPLEFAGYLTTAEGMKYVVRDPSKKISSFLRLNESDPNLGVVVKQHDMSQNTLTIEYQGKPLTLEVRKAKIISSGNPAMMMPQPMPMPQPVTANVAPAVTQTVVVNPSPADEQKRLEAVAAEVARRRALREQAGQPGAPGTPPVAIPAAPPMPANTLPVQR